MAEPPNPPTTGDRAAYIVAAAKLLDLTIDASWTASVSDNLAVLTAAAARVAAFPLPDEAEPAPVFEA